MDNRFISLEDEIQLRMSIKSVYKHEGIAGVYQVMGELITSFQIVSEVAQEILEEEKKNQGEK